MAKATPWRLKTKAGIANEELEYEAEERRRSKRNKRKRQIPIDEDPELVDDDIDLMNESKI